MRSTLPVDGVGLLLSGLRGLLCAGLTALMMASFSARFLVATDVLAPTTASLSRNCCAKSADSAAGPRKPGTFRTRAVSLGGSRFASVENVAEGETFR